MSTLPEPAPLVRTGTCRLQLQIDQAVYSVRRRPGCVPGAKHWHLKKLSGPRAGTTYVLTAHKGSIDCSCPDTSMNKCVCKHIRAVQACGLASRRLVPVVVRVRAHQKSGGALALVATGKEVAHV